jgi:ATP-dependent Clp protease protease subunit
MTSRLDLLVRDNARVPRPQARVAGETGAATMYLYDVIDRDFGVNAADFNAQIATLKGQPIALRINSPGGDVFDGRAMATAIAAHGQVTAYIDGLAASAATYVALAAARVEITPGGFFMIHNAWTAAFGNKEDLLDTAALLEKIDASLVADYVRKTGQPAQQIIDWMTAETWFTGEEATELGFTDATFTAPAVQAHWQLAAYRNTPNSLIAPIESPALAAPVFDAAARWQRNANALRLHEIG